MYTLTIIAMTSINGYNKTITLSFIPQVGAKLSFSDIIENSTIKDVDHLIELDGTFSTTVILERMDWKDSDKELLSIGFTVI